MRKSYLPNEDKTMLTSGPKNINININSNNTKQLEKTDDLFQNNDKSTIRRKMNKSDPQLLANFGKNLINSNDNTMKQMSIESILKFTNFLIQNFNEELDFFHKNQKEIETLNDNNIIHNKNLRLLKQILHFECFTIINKKTNPAYLKLSNIMERVKILINILTDIQKVLKSEIPTRMVIFFDESECVKCFMKLFPREFFKNNLLRKIFSEFWKFTRNNKFIEPNPKNMLITFERLRLFLFGISFPSPYPEDYPLHQAVFQSNLPLIRRLCSNEDLSIFHCSVDESDPMGMTALMLAVKLCKEDAVLVLLDNGADPLHRTFPYVRTPLEEAIKLKCRSIIRTLISADWHLKKLQWKNNNQQVLNFLEGVPDFNFDMNWECDSKIIPFVKKYAPSDKYNIYKRGSNLRIDMTLIGFTKLQCLRGNVSLILKGKGSDAGKLLMVDHIEKKVTDLLSDISIATLDSQVDELIKQESYSSEVKADNVYFKPAENWRGEKVTQKIENYNTVKYNAKGTVSFMYTKRNIIESTEVGKFKSFENYFDYAVQNPFWAYEDEPIINGNN